MKTRWSTQLAVLAGLTALSTAVAQASHSLLYRPVIVAYANVNGKHTDGIGQGSYLNNHPVQMTPDGTGLELVHGFEYNGDLSHGRGTRYILDVLPDDGSTGPWALRVCSEDDVLGEPSWSAPLVQEPDLRIDWARWSIDGNRICFGARRAVRGDTGNITGWTEQGIWVGEVTRDDLGRPATLSYALRIPATTAATSGASWCSDNRRLAFTPDGASTIHIGDANTGAVVNTNIIGVDPRFSPVAGDSRIVFNRYMYTYSGSIARYDLFIYNTTTGTEVQLTNKTKCSKYDIGQPDWSPDALHVAFRAGDYWFNGGPGIHRIKADGTQKAVELTSPKRGAKQTMGGPRWRA